MRILLVEDRADVRELLAELLEEELHEVATVADFSSAVAALRDSPRWDALISDVRLPGGGDGLRLAAEAERTATPTLLFTGDPEHMILLEVNGIPHLRKPFPLTDVLAWLQRLPGAAHKSQ
jgi:DNA-binding response OmpR family regulator